MTIENGTTEENSNKNYDNSLYMFSQQLSLPRLSKQNIRIYQAMYSRKTFAILYR